MNSYSRTCAKFHRIFEGKNSSLLIGNISSELFLGGKNPVIANKNTDHSNSYVSSLYSAFISYPLEEIDLIEDKKARVGARVAIKTLGMVFKIIGIEKSAFVGNFLISTNFYPASLTSGIAQLMPVLRSKFEDEYICIRSLNEEKNSELIAVLRAIGWSLLPARVVYLFDFASLEERKKKNHYKKDMKLLATTTLECSNNCFNDSDYLVMQKLFEALYIEKHSSQNPRFGAEFIRKAYESGFLELYAYRQDGKIIAFIAVLEMEGVISTPMLGYDTSLPQEMGLYRLLCAKLHSIAEDRRMDINFSSGAGEFKKLRGAKPVLEYTAVYAKHLPFYKQKTIELLSKILDKNMRSFFKTNNLI
jgi:Acetyltransferase (GNAT) domain